MKKDNIKKRIDGLNEYMLSDSNLQLLLLKISNDYTYNKAIALVDKNCKNKDWYSIDDKNCFKTWDEIDALQTAYVKEKILTLKDKKDKFVKLIKF